ncbi:MAG: HNH endonuclease [Pseudomonadota bacterium]
MPQNFQFKRHRIDKFSKERMLSELEKAAAHFKYIEFGWRDFNKVASISATPIKKEFGGWKTALTALNEHLKTKGLRLHPRKVPPNRIYSDADLFNEMERIWKALGHRPSRTEWEASEPQISYTTYKQRFKGWQNACLKFIESKMGEHITADDNFDNNSDKKHRNHVRLGENNKIKTELTRTIPLRLRLKVLSRDNFRCVYCGRSPATDVGIKLHLDHIIPFSKCGKSVENNLQTLCQDCNLGKGDKTKLKD